MDTNDTPQKFILTIGSYTPGYAFTSREFSTHEYESLEKCEAHYHRSASRLRLLGQSVYSGSVQCPDGKIITIY